MPIVNPVLARLPDGGIIPHLNPHESLVLRRVGVVLDSKIVSVGNLSARGVLFLTDQRVVFVAQTNLNRQDFGSLEVSYSELHVQPSFEQPIFGANYLFFKADSSVVKFKFHEGGCNTLVPCLFTVFQDSKKRTEPRTFSSVNYRQTHCAFIDASDPSTFYVSQPKDAVAFGKD